MALNFVYPTAAVMYEILPDLLARDRADRLGLKLFPVKPEPTFYVRWTQRDSAYGLMHMRGLDGQPPRVQRLGMNTFVQEPGVYGEYMVHTERELLTRAAPNSMDLPIPLSDLVAEDNALMAARMDNRMESNVWTMLATGKNVIPMPGPNGVNIYTDQYPIQTYVAPVPWANTSTATPILNIQAMQQLSLGHGASFGADATLYMNQVTANLLLANANAADFGGRRNQFGATFNNVAAYNSYFAGQNLPQIVVYDEGFLPYPVAGTVATPVSQYQKYIPDHVVILVGKRPANAPLGHWRQTIQAMQPGARPAPGEYNFVKDFARGVNAPVEVPPKVEVHMGFNGSMSLEFPSAIVAGTV